MGYFRKAFGVLMMIILLASIPSYATTYSFQVGQELTQGQTDYDIGISLLEFPVSNTVFPYLQGDVQLTDKIKVSAHFSTGRNTDQSKKFLDSDFRVANDPDTLFVYSESDNDLKMHRFSIDLDYQLYQHGNYEILVGAGFKQHQFDYEIYNVHQWLVNVPNSDQYINDVTALTYKSTENIPYISLGYRQTWSKLSIDIETQYSTMVRYNGFDDHVLRSKHIDFSGTGDYLSVGINTRYMIRSNWALSLGYHYSMIQTYGEHTQTRYADTSEGGAGLIGTGTQLTETTLSSLNASLSYHF